jgi:flagellar biosynthesis chaperone FliJ
MPYRRLPNTDSARLKSLKSAYERGKDLPPFKLAFSSNSYRKIQAVLPQFENAISEHKNSLNLQAEKNKEYQKRLKKARIYISHFIQVVNMAIMRGELSADTRKYFGMDQDESKVPPLTSEEEVIAWGKKLIEGEQTRRNRGMNPVTNPTIAILKVHYDKFMEYHNYQKSLKDRSQRAQDELSVRRAAVDGVIQQVWNEVENTYGNLPEETRREKATEYGLIYVFRKNELTNSTLFQSSRAG